MKRVLAVLLIMFFSAASAQEMDYIKIYNTLINYNVSLLRRSNDFMSLKIDFRGGKLTQNEFAIACVRQLGMANIDDNTPENLLTSTFLPFMKKAVASGYAMPAPVEVLRQYAYVMAVKKQGLQIILNEGCGAKSGSDFYSSAIMTGEQVQKLADVILALLEDLWARTPH